MIKLFDLVRASKSDPENQVFVMRAPLSTISDYLDLRREAENRIRYELETLGQCELFKSQGRWRDHIHTVTLPVGER